MLDAWRPSVLSKTSYRCQVQALLLCGMLHHARIVQQRTHVVGDFLNLLPKGGFESHPLSVGKGQSHVGFNSFHKVHVTLVAVLSLRTDGCHTTEILFNGMGSSGPHQRFRFEPDCEDVAFLKLSKSFLLHSAICCASWAETAPHANFFKVWRVSLLGIFLAADKSP